MSIPKNLPQPFQAINTLAEAIPWKRPAAFHMDQLLEEASRDTRGLTDFGRPYFKEGLQVLLDSIREEIEVHYIGEKVLEQMFLNALRNRLLLFHYARKEGFRDQALISPIFITGLSRSGSTLLHRLLGLDDQNLLIPIWQAYYPFPERSERARFHSMKRRIDLKKKLLPDLDRAHYTDVNSPEECILPMTYTFHSYLFWQIMPARGYYQWWGEQDNDLEAYRDYLLFLKYFQHQNPGKRLVLKAPAHLSKLEIIEQVFPGARYLWTHRDPVKTIPSLSSLQTALYPLVSAKIDLHMLGKTNLEGIREEVKKGIAYDRSRPGMIRHLAYRDIVSNSIRVIKDIYRAFKLDWRPVFESRLKRYLLENPRHKSGIHLYRAEDYGLTESRIKREMEHYRIRYKDWIGMET